MSVHTAIELQGDYPPRAGMVDFEKADRQARAALGRLAVQAMPDLYYAAFPSYIQLFTRDSLTGAQIAGDECALAAQLVHSLDRLGRSPDPLTGEEAGRPYHEWPGNVVRGEEEGLKTTFNACDNAAWALSIGLSHSPKSC